MKKNKANEVLRKHAAGAIGAGISTVLILGSMGSVALAAPPASSSTDAPSAHSSDPAKSIHCGGAVAKNFFLVDGLTKDEVQEVLTRKLTEQGLNPSDYTITIEDSKIKKANAGSYGDGRRNRVMTVEVTITPKAAGAPAVTCNTRILYYTPPFAFLDKGKFPQNHTHHNVGKLVVDNPDSYTISPEDKVKLIDAFLKANPNLQLEKSQLQMDDNGNLTITNKAGEDPYSVTVPAEEFVSVVGKVKDILVFLDPATGNKLSTEVPAVRVPLKAGNWDDSDLWGTNNAGANRNLSAKAQLSGLDLKREGNELVISGKFDSSISNNAGGTRYLGIHRNSSKEYNYTQSFSNGFKVRVVPLKEDIVVRNLDKDAKFTQADVEKLIDVDYKKLNPLKFNQDKGLTAAQIRADVNSKIIRKISVDGLKHELGTQEFSGTLRTDLNVVSPVLKATAIYYTEKIPATLVSDPDKLTPDQIAEITSKVKKVNKLKDTDKVTVDKAGNVTIEFKRDKNDHNKVNATKKFKAPLAQAKYPDGKVETGKSIESPITTPEGYKFPTGTKFVVDGDAPDGLTVGQDGKITYNAPKDKTPGEVTGKILVTLPGHDKPTAVPYKITVIPAVPEMSYPDKKVEAGKSVETPITTPDGYTFPKGSKFEVKDAPKGVTVDETGKITYNAPKDKTPGEVTGKILVTLPGHDKPTAVPYKITVIPAVPEMSYPDKKVEAGKSVETPITTPDGYTFPKGSKFEVKDAPKGVTVEETGKITYNAPKDQPAGDVKGEVLVTLPGHDKPTPVPFKITVTPVEPKASYEDKKVPAGESTEVIPTPADGYKFPTGTTFTIDGKTPDGLTIDPKTGKITYTAPKDSPHKEVTGNVLVNVPGRDKPTPVPFKITVAPATPKLSYPDGKVETGKSIETPITTPDGYKFPTGTTFTIDGKTPDGLTIDPKTGKITYNVPEGHQPGDVTGKVKVTIPGTDNPIEVPFKITVTPVPTQPSYPTATGTPGASVDLKLQPGDQPLPQGTTFTKESGPDYVTVTPDGTVTVKVPDSANGGETIQGTVEITYPDGTTKKVPYLVRVEKEEGPAADDSKPQPPTTQDSDHTVPDTGDTTNPDQDKPAPADQDKPAPADQDKPAPADTGKPATPADQGKQVAGGKGHKVTKTVTKAVQDEGAKKQAPTTLSHTGTVAGTASLLGIILAAVGAAGVAFRRRKNND